MSAFPDGDNLFEWVGTIKGSTGTVYEGLTFKLSLKFSAEYPFKAPIICFTTPVRRRAAMAAGELRARAAMRMQ